MVLFSLLFPAFCFILCKAHPPRLSDTTSTSWCNQEHKRQSHEIRHLRNQMDRVLLRQKTDHILIHNLQQVLEKMEDKLDRVQTKSRQSYTQDVSNEQLNLNQKNDDVVSESDLPNSKKINLDELRKTLLEELHLIRSEVETVKKSCKNNASVNQPLKMESAMEWVQNLIPHLQENVKDLQESTNVLQAMHDKQEIDSKLKALNKDVSNVQNSLVRVTSRVESAAATAENLSDELARNSAELHKTETKMTIASEQLEEQKGFLDDLLRALPDGFLSRLPDRTTKTLETNSLTGRLQSDGPNIGSKKNDKIERLDMKTSSLDFALMNLQKKVFMETSLNDSAHFGDSGTNHFGEEHFSLQNFKLQDANLTGRIIVLEDELARIKVSSEYLLKIFSNVEKENLEAEKNVMENLAKIEAQIEEEKDVRKSKNDDTKLGHQELKLEIQTGILEFKREVNGLTNKLKILEKKSKFCSENLSKNNSNPKYFETGKTDEEKINEIFDYELIQNKINQYESRITKLESIISTYEHETKHPQQNTRKHRRRHRHGS